MMVPPATVSLMASRALSRCAMHHIASRHAVVGIGQRMASSHRFAPSTFLLHSLSSSSSSPPSSSRGGLARFFSGSRPPLSGPAARSTSSVQASDTLPRKSKTKKQPASSDKATKIELDKLKVNGEIDAVTSEIRAEKSKWEKANDKDKAFYQTSIDTLYEALKDLRATRAKLIDASIAVPVPAPGKSTPLYELCALCCRRPPLCVHR